MYRLDYRMEEIKAVRSTIEQDSRLLFGGMLERLKSSEGYKTSVLQHEMAGIQQDIEAINSTISTFTELTNDGVPPLEFMVKAPMLRQNIEYILGKQIKTDIEVYPYDLPRELFHIRKELEENNQLEKLCQMKDQIIFELSFKMRNVFKESVADLDKAANQEISSWATLTDKYMMELQDYQRVCYYCSIPLNEDTINSACGVNVDKSIAQKFNGFTEKEPKSEFHGTFQHYFHKPKAEILSSPEAFENLQRIFFDKNNNPYKQSLILQIDKILVEIRKKVFKEHIELNKLFKNDDKEGTGIITTTSFAYLVNEFLQVPEEHIVNLLKILDPSNRNLVHYMDFIVLVHDPNSLENMPLFKLADQARIQMLEKQKDIFPTQSQNGSQGRQSFGGASPMAPMIPTLPPPLPIITTQGGFPGNPDMNIPGRPPLLIGKNLPDRTETRSLGNTGI